MWQNTKSFAAQHRLLKFYHGYRIVLALSLLLPISLGLDIPLFKVSQGAYLWVLPLCNLVFAFITVAISSINKIFYEKLFMPALYAEALLLVTLIHTLGSLHSPLSLVVLIPVLFASQFFNNKAALAFTATMSITLLLEQSLNVFWLQTYANAFYNAGILGLICFAITLSFDRLSEQLSTQIALTNIKEKQIQELSHINDTIIAMLQLGVLVLDKNNTIIMMNNCAKSLLGIGGNHPQSLHALPALFQKHYEVLAQDDDADATFVVPESNATIRLSLLSLKTSPDITKEYQLILLHNVIEETQQAQQIKLSALGQLTGQIAHEIRNPLSAIKTSTQLISESIQPNEEQQRLFSILNQHTDRVNNVVTTMLSLTKKEVAQQDVFELNEWLAHYFDQFQSVDLQQTNIIFDQSHEHYYINGDKGHISQILTNLLENALHFSHEQTDRATVRCKLLQEHNAVKLEIHDTGPGISEEHLLKIWDPFYSTRKAGSGLGLYIVKALCDANKIRIMVKESTPAGTTFQLTFDSTMG